MRMLSDNNNNNNNINNNTNTSSYSSTSTSSTNNANNNANTEFNRKDHNYTKIHNDGRSMSDNLFGNTKDNT